MYDNVQLIWEFLYQLEMTSSEETISVINLTTMLKYVDVSSTTIISLTLLQLLA